MASAKQIEAWVREVRPRAARVEVVLRKRSVAICVDGEHHTLPSRAIGFPHVAQALLTLGPSCAEDDAKHEH